MTTMPKTFGTPCTHLNAYVSRVNFFDPDEPTTHASRIKTTGAVNVCSHTALFEIQTSVTYILIHTYAYYSSIECSRQNGWTESMSRWVFSEVWPRGVSRSVQMSVIRSVMHTLYYTLCTDSVASCYRVFQCSSCVDWMTVGTCRV